MPTVAEILSYTPTVLFWLLVVAVVFAEFIGKMHATTQRRGRWVTLWLIFGLGVWYASETANHVNLTGPDLQPWNHFVSDTPAKAAQ